MPWSQKHIAEALDKSRPTMSQRIDRLGVEQRREYTWSDAVALTAAQLLQDERGFSTDLAAVAAHALRDQVEPLLADDRESRLIVLSWDDKGQPAAAVFDEVEPAVLMLENTESVAVNCRPVLTRAARLLLAVEEKNAATKH